MFRIVMFKNGCLFLISVTEKWKKIAKPKDTYSMWDTRSFFLIFLEAIIEDDFGLIFYIIIIIIILSKNGDDFRVIFLSLLFFFFPFIKNLVEKAKKEKLCGYSFTTLANWVVINSIDFVIIPPSQLLATNFKNCS